MRLLLLAAALWAAAPAWTPAVKPPKGWSARPGDGGATLLSGPQGDLLLAPLVSIRRYGKGGEFKDADAYVKVQSEPGIIAVKGQKAPVVDKVKLKRGELSRVTRWATEFVPPSSMDSVEVLLREEHVVVPGKEGFTALVFAAPEKGFEKHRKAFSQVLESFTAGARD